MATSYNIAAYEDCFGIMNEALSSKSVIRAKFESWGDATHFRMRMNKARTLDRQLNAEVYSDPSHPLYRKSEYDALWFRVSSEEDGHWVYVESRAKPLVIEKVEAGVPPKRRPATTRRF